MARTPTDPTKAQVWITKGLDDLDFEFYIPQGPKGDPGGVTLGTTIGASNLDQFKSPGVYRQDNGSYPALALNYPIVASGILYVDDRLGGASSVMQTYYPFTGASGINPRQHYRRYLVSSTTWGPWESYVAQRVDQSAGRAIYTWDTINQRDQLIYGDTGWRDVMPSSGTAAWIRLRRIGGMVSVWVADWVNGTNSDIVALPVGFRTGTNSIVANWGIRSNAPLNVVVSGPGAVVQAAQSANALSAFITYPTIESWPTALPGTASGSIPNA